MAKVVMIGIDAMDRHLVSKFRSELPNLRRLQDESPDISSISVFPPDTPTAWASIFTGLNPAKHGVVMFVDPLERVSRIAYEDLDNQAIRGRAFWDYAGKQGRKVCLLFPELGYPVWPVNGCMVSRSKQRYAKFNQVVTYPDTLATKYDLSKLSTVKTVPKKNAYAQFISDYQRLMSAEVDFTLKMLKEDNWDLFFSYSAALDWIGHNLWSYFDDTDPAYPGKNPYQDVFKDFYKAYDDAIGLYREVAGANTVFIVFSDHGQCMRPDKLVNINEILRRIGLLVPRIKRTNVSDPYYAVEYVKQKIADFVNRHGAGSAIMKMMHIFPTVKNLYTSPMSIDWQETVAYVSDLSGIKSYSYGGVIIKRENLRGRDYEDVRKKVVEALETVQELGTTQNLMQWVCRREDLYSGPFIDKYPDVIFQLRLDYGAGWAIFAPVLGASHTHNIQPGSHRQDSPVFLVGNLDGLRPTRSQMQLMDVAPTVLDLLGINEDFRFDGNSIFERRT